MQKHKKLKIIAGLSFIPLVILLGLFLLTGENLEILKTVFSEDLTNEEIQDHLSGLGIRGYVTISILAMLQLVIAVFPAEPVQVVAGLTFGLWRGVLACTVGVIVGNTIVYVLYKIYGDKLREYFNSKIDIDFSHGSAMRAITVVIFIMYFLPAIPYGMICFLAATLGMKYPRFIITTTLGAIPSVFIGVWLGHIALASSWIISVAVLAVLILILAIVMKKREFFISKINDYLKKTNEPYSSKTVVKKYSRFKLSVLYFGFRIFALARIKYVVKNKIKPERPSIVLCNHGSFVDFMYAGSMLREQSPNFIVARLYFYKKLLGKILRAVGCFPKSMFATDTESAMNCVRAIMSGGVLAMMPEARLSTVGKYEDIQESTFAFLKKMGVHVYTIKMEGDYFALPKWGKGIRRGSLVEADMQLLFTPEQLEALSVEEIKEQTENVLRYDEFKWLDEHPKQRYKSKKLAEGLENILSVCPKCGAKYSIETKGRELFCTECDLKTHLTDRYAFPDGFKFKNFAEWYEWQFDAMKSEILADENYSLASKVELRHASKDGKTLLNLVGEGECRLDRSGLTYVGTEYSESVEKHFPMSSIYRLLFGAGEDFEIYVGKEIYYFTPSERKSCVDWYIASIILKDFT